ncbi:MAG: DUF3577 domain-containing protein [Burkholderiales bacterium]|jgi:hypothetical protein|nr:DUF3577 domain-containing protein [Burkholderiales bacterium]
MNQAQTTKYFDLHLKGIGYLNRIREVKPKKGDSFWACSIAALRGNSDKPEYTNLDCHINGAEALKQIRRCVNAVEADKKVLIGFTVGDIYPETFEFKNGARKGEEGICNKGRLLFVKFIMIDGKEVYRAQREENSADNTDAPAPAQAEAQPEKEAEETAAADSEESF